MKKFKNKNMLIVGGILLALLCVGIFATQAGKKAESSNKADVLPDVEVLPKVGPDVKVSIEADKKKQEATLEISGVPEGTDFIEYELSYDALVEKELVPKGVIGTIEFDGDDPISRDITLGTCSSGTCKYDVGVEKIKVTLKFQGDYGAQLFEGEFEI